MQFYELYLRLDVEKLTERNSKNVVHHFESLFLKIDKLVDQRNRDVKTFMRRMSRAAVISDDKFDDDVVHVFNLLEADLSCEDDELSQNKHLSDHFFLNFSHVRFSF
jgi:hypothetical protein